MLSTQSSAELGELGLSASSPIVVDEGDSSPESVHHPRADHVVRIKPEVESLTLSPSAVARSVSSASTTETRRKSTPSTSRASRPRPSPAQIEAQTERAGVASGSQNSSADHTSRFAEAGPSVEWGSQLRNQEYAASLRRERSVLNNSKNYAPAETHEPTESPKRREPPPSRTASAWHEVPPAQHLHYPQFPSGPLPSSGAAGPSSTHSQPLPHNSQSEPLRSLPRTQSQPLPSPQPSSQPPVPLNLQRAHHPPRSGSLPHATANQPPTNGAVSADSRHPRPLPPSDWADTSPHSQPNTVYPPQPLVHRGAQPAATDHCPTPSPSAPSWATQPVQPEQYPRPMSQASSGAQDLAPRRSSHQDTAASPRAAPNTVSPRQTIAEEAPMTAELLDGVQVLRESTEARLEIVGDKLVEQRKAINDLMKVVQSSLSFQVNFRQVVKETIGEVVKDTIGEVVRDTIGEVVKDTIEKAVKDMIGKVVREELEHSSKPQLESIAQLRQQLDTLTADLNPRTSELSAGGGQPTLSTPASSSASDLNVTSDVAIGHPVSLDAGSHPVSLDAGSHSAPTLPTPPANTHVPSNDPPSDTISPAFLSWDRGLSTANRAAASDRLSLSSASARATAAELGLGITWSDSTESWPQRTTLQHATPAPSTSTTAKNVPDMTVAIDGDPLQEFEDDSDPGQPFFDSLPSPSVTASQPAVEGDGHDHHGDSDVNPAQTIGVEPQVDDRTDDGHEPTDNDLLQDVDQAELCNQPRVNNPPDPPAQQLANSAIAEQDNALAGPSRPSRKRKASGRVSLSPTKKSRESSIVSEPRKRRPSSTPLVRFSGMLPASDGEPRGTGIWPKIPRDVQAVRYARQEIICSLCNGRVHWGCAGLDKNVATVSSVWNCPDCQAAVDDGLESLIEDAPQDRCIRYNCFRRRKQKMTVESEDENEYTVEKLIGRRAVDREVVDGKSVRVFKYLVLWAGYPIEEATWERKANLHLDENGTSTALINFDRELLEVIPNKKKRRRRVCLLPEARSAWHWLTGEPLDGSVPVEEDPESDTVAN